MPEGMEQSVDERQSIFNFKVLRTPLIIVSMGILLEIIFRVSSFGWPTALNWIKYNPRGILMTDLVMTVDNPAISWKLRPQVNTIFQSKKFTTNSLGFRAPETDLSKAPGKKRIVIIGRSISMGWGVADDETYSAVLQDSLDHWKPGAYEVINCSVGGYSLYQATNFYREYVTPLDPDIVFIPLSKKDMRKTDVKSVRPLSDARPSLTNFGYYLSYTYLYESSRFIVKRLTKPFISADWKERSDDIGNEDGETESNQHILSAFIEERYQEGVECYVYSPHQEIITQGIGSVPLVDWIDNQPGASFLNMDNYVSGRMPSNTHIYFGDAHPNAAVQALYAQALFNYFRTGTIKN